LILLYFEEKYYIIEYIKKVGFDFIRYEIVWYIEENY